VEEGHPTTPHIRVKVFKAENLGPDLGSAAGLVTAGKLPGGARFWRRLLLVGGGAEGGGDGDFQEAEVDSKLGAVMDHVVEEHVAVGFVTRGYTDQGALPGEGEGFVPGGVREGLEGVGEAGYEGVVLGEEFVAGGHAQDLAGVFGGAHVDAGTGEEEVGKAGELGGVSGEAGEGHGPGVGGEVVVAVGDGGEDFTSHGQLMGEFGK
jgi:hypothetical protein